MGFLSNFGLLKIHCIFFIRTFGKLEFRMHIYSNDKNEMSRYLQVEGFIEHKVKK